MLYVSVQHMSFRVLIAFGVVKAKKGASLNIQSQTDYSQPQKQASHVPGIHPLGKSIDTSMFGRKDDIRDLFPQWYVQLFKPSCRYSKQPGDQGVSLLTP